MQKLIFCDRKHFQTKLRLVRKEKQQVSTGKTKQPDHNQINSARKKINKEEDDIEKEEEDYMGITERH